MINVPGCKSSHHGARSPNGRFSPCGPRVPEYFSEAPPFLYYILLLFRLLEKWKKEKNPTHNTAIVYAYIYMNRVTHTSVYMQWCCAHACVHVRVRCPPPTVKRTCPTYVRIAHAVLLLYYICIMYMLYIAVHHCVSPFFL